MVSSSGVNTMFIGDDFPELGTDLVTALSSLNVNDFSQQEDSHGFQKDFGR